MNSTQHETDATVEIEISNGSDAGRCIRCTARQTVTLGSSQTCDFHLTDPRVSRVHCQVRCTHDGRIIVRDLESDGGTWLNGARISVCELQTNDELRVGSTSLRVMPRDRQSGDSIPAENVSPTLRAIAAFLSHGPGRPRQYRIS